MSTICCILGLESYDQVEEIHMYDFEAILVMLAKILR